MAELDLSRKAGGVPIWVWIFGGTVIGGGAWVVIRNRQKSKAASQVAENQAAVTANTTPATSGDFSTDQAEAIFSDIRNLQGQETQFAGTASNLSNQLTGVSQQVSQIPSGPTGATGPPGPPGPAPAPVPTRPSPTLHYAQVKTDGKHSINFYASEYGASLANILAQTAKSEPSDYNSPNSALHKYIVKGAWSNVVPAGYTLFVPYYR